MVIMSDGEAFGFKFSVILLAICLLVLLFSKFGKHEDYTQNPYNSIIQEPITIVDTLYIKDTVYVNITKYDTVYITASNNIENVEPI